MIVINLPHQIKNYKFKMICKHLNKIIQRKKKTLLFEECQLIKVEEMTKLEKSPYSNMVIQSSIFNGYYNG